MRWDDPVSLDGTPSPHGIFLHPTRATKPARARFNIGGKFKRLEGVVSLRDTVERAGSPLQFSIWGDGKELWRSKLVETRAETQTFQVNVTGIDRLELMVECKADSTQNVHAVWCEPKLISGK